MLGDGTLISVEKVTLVRFDADGAPLYEEEASAAEFTFTHAELWGSSTPRSACEHRGQMRAQGRVLAPPNA